MKKKYYILSLISAMLAMGLLYLGLRTSLGFSPAAILVFAGNDTYTCVNGNLDLPSLQATISGDVTDGDWITLGDGRFQPGNVTTIRYSTGISYMPGANDKFLGSFKLLLISDAPLNNPQAKVVDDVNITFQNAPPLVCSNNLNISLNENCIQKVDVTMLQPNPQPPYSNYIITLYDTNGSIIPNSTLTKAHIDKELTFKIGHQCTNNICWGKLRVEDYLPPLFFCTNDTILCIRSTSPDSLGFPFKTTAYIDTIINSKYIIKDWDACSDVVLEYKDEVVKANCQKDEDRTIKRKWKATDEKGNQSTCHQIIVIKRISLPQVIFPKNYDGHQLPFFECSDTFPMLPNGYPSPDTTGSPEIGQCSNLQFNMADIKFELCGKSFKIVRSWFVIDWCTSESMTRNQIILVKDSKAPEIMCLETFSLSASSYICAVNNVEIPAPESIIDCSDFDYTVELFSLNSIAQPQYIRFIQDKFYFINLPVGQYRLQYNVTDVCNNVSSCTSLLYIIDETAPYPVCDQTTKASVDDQGWVRIFATTFDDGSSDNCGIAGYRVRKMNDSCGFGTQFGDYVDFCCSEIGQTKMVALEVTDIHGLKNTCMVEVVIEDKLKPKITCPPDITLACDDSYDFENLNDFGTVVTNPSEAKDIYVNNYYHDGIVGRDGVASDNCSVSVVLSYSTGILCHIGYIKRKFVAIDANGLKDSCVQTITILNPMPFNEENIIWPTNYEADGCKSSQINPEITGKPQFENTSCATVAATYEDKKFYIADGACLKIIRTWTVVDWCQFNGSNAEGIWGPFIQIIKLHNTDKPYFTSTCVDSTFCSYDAQCNTGYIELHHTGMDSCTDVSDLIWKFKLDIYNDGDIDSLGNLSYFEGELPLGSHRFTWQLEDQCGNFTNCSQVITIVDCKKPSPYCLTSLTLSLAKVTGTITVWAKDFDLGSFDNCTEKRDLIFTFYGAFPVDSLIHEQHYFKENGILSDSITYDQGNAQIWIPDTKTSGLKFDCKDIPNGISNIISLDMTVTDFDQNQDFCNIELILQDNSDVCLDVITHGKISGSIKTTSNKVPESTMVQFSGGTESQTGQKIIEDNGLFQIDSLPLGLDYLIQPTLNSDPLDGVTTLDLVLIQRHILGILPFNNPYKLIAADVNTSKLVTASDLVELRKLILGINDKFPKNLDSWVFIPNDYVFQDNLMPYEYENSILISDLSAHSENNNFIAVKMGDVNDTATGSNIKSNAQTENRTEKQFKVLLSEEILDGESVLVFRSGQNVKMDGMQLFLEYDGNKLLFENAGAQTASQFDHFESYSIQNHIRFVGYNSETKAMVENQILAYVKLNSSNADLRKFSLDLSRLSEIYTENQNLGVQLMVPNNIISKEPYFALLTNPVVSDLKIKKIRLDDLKEVRYTISDSNGTVVKKSELNGDDSLHDEIGILLPDDLRSGIYFITLSNDNINQVIKFIKIN